MDVEAASAGLVRVLAGVTDLALDATVSQAREAIDDLERGDVSPRIDDEGVRVDLRGDLPAPPRETLRQLAVEAPDGGRRPPAAEAESDQGEERGEGEPAVGGEPGPQRSLGV